MADCTAITCSELRIRATAHRYPFKVMGCDETQRDGQQPPAIGDLNILEAAGPPRRVIT